MRTGTVVVVVLLLMTGAGLRGQSQLPWYILANGGHQHHPNSSRLLSATVGQPLAGPTALTDGRDLDQGFWLPLLDVVGVDDEEEQRLTWSAFPNPMSDAATFRLITEHQGSLTIRIHSVIGALLRTMTVDVTASRIVEIVFDGLDDSGRPLASGAYHVEIVLDSGQNSSVQKRFVHQLTIVR